MNNMFIGLNLDKRKKLGLQTQQKVQISNFLLERNWNALRQIVICYDKSSSVYVCFAVVSDISLDSVIITIVIQLLHQSPASTLHTLSHLVFIATV